MFLLVFKWFVSITLYVLILTLFLSLSVLIGCGESGNATDEKVNQKTERVVNVVARTIKTREFTNYLRLVGEVKPARRVVVSVEASGLIKSIEFKKGEAVDKNDVLASLEDRLLQASVDEAEAALNASSLALRNHKRLYEQKALAKSVYLDTKYRHDMDRARYDQAAAYLSKTVIRAPISGVVDSKHLEVGELANAGRQLVDLVDIDQITIVAGVPERHLKHVEKGTRATLTFPVYPEVSVEESITYIGTTLDPDSRTVPIEISLDNPGHRLKPEMAVTIRVVKDYINQAIVIPQDAVIDTDQGRTVFVVDNNTARSVPIKLGSISGDQVVVSEGLAVGDSLIVIGHRNLVDGESIQVKNDRM